MQISSETLYSRHALRWCIVQPPLRVTKDNLWQNLSLLVDLPSDHLRAAWRMVIDNHAYKTVAMGRRTLHLPSPLVEEVQKKILHRLLSNGPISPAAYGGVTGRSFVDAARVHLTKNTSTVLSLDVTNAFESTFFSEIKRALRSRLRTDLWVLGADRADVKELIEVLTFLVTVPKGQKTRRLPLGTSTSVALFNLVMLPADQRILAWCQPQGIRYTRYIDDLVFSSSENLPKELEKLVYQTLRKHNLKLNSLKTSRQRSPDLTIHNLILANERVVPSEALLNRIANSSRSCIDKLGSAKELSNTDPNALHELKGMYHFLMQFYGTELAQWPHQVRTLLEYDFSEQTEQHLELLWTSS